MPKSLKILSCFVDESGDFGDYSPHNPYYTVSVVLHDQGDPINKQLVGLEKYLSDLGYPHHALHAGPLVRRESDYSDMQMEDRKKMFNLLFILQGRFPFAFSASVSKSPNAGMPTSLMPNLQKQLRTPFRSQKISGTVTIKSSFTMTVVKKR